MSNQCQALQMSKSQYRWDAPRCPHAATAIVDGYGPARLVCGIHARQRSPDFTSAEIDPATLETRFLADYIQIQAKHNTELRARANQILRNVQQVEDEIAVAVLRQSQG